MLSASVIDLLRAMKLLNHLIHTLPAEEMVVSSHIANKGNFCGVLVLHFP